MSNNSALFSDVLGDVQSILDEIGITPKSFFSGSVEWSFDEPWQHLLEGIEEEAETPGHKCDIVSAVPEAHKQLYNRYTPHSWVDGSPTSMKSAIDELSESSFSTPKRDGNHA